MNFKVILALSASLTSFHSMADCLGEICVGEKVISSSNEISSVIAIDKTESKIITKNNNYSSLRSYSPGELSDEVVSSIYPSGKTVLDEYNVIGTVNVVFRNGKIVYRRNGYSSDNISSNLSPEVSEIKELKAGERIIDEYNVRGEVKRLFQNGSVFYRRDGYSSDNMTKAGALVLRVNNLGEHRVNTEIIDEYNVQGRVTDLYQDGRTFYRRNGYSSDNMAANPKTLVLKVESVDGLSNGTSIIDEYNVTGRVTTTFKDGRVFYRRNGYSSDNLAQSSKLVKEVSNLEEIKPGTFAIDTYNVPGKVTNCFADGRLLFKRDGYSSTNVVTTVHPEVQTHKLYSKDVRYASDNSKVGTPSAFFSNGMILHAGTVVSTLHESVEEYSEVTKETDVYSVLGKVAKIKEIFSNGVVTLDDKEGSISKIIDYKSLKDKSGVLASLTYGLSMHVQFNEIDKQKYHSPLVFNAENASLVKSDLIENLNKTDSYPDKQTRKKVLSLLANSNLPGDSEIQDPEEYSLSVTPAEIIDDVKAILDQDQKKYVFVSPAAAAASRKAIIIDISKGAFKSTCSIVIKERNVEIRKVNKKIGKKDSESCLSELKD